MTHRFLDTNILMRYFVRDDEKKAAVGKVLLRRVAAGKEVVVTSPLVLFEIVFTLQRTYKLPKDRVAEAVLSVVNLRGVKLPQKPLWRAALERYVRDDMDFADAYNAAYMQVLGITEIYSWDRGIDRVLDIARIEPTADEQLEAA